jgi:tetratricopeptide (TPR) repeat protein
MMIGDTYRQRQRYEEAEGEYKKALALVPNEPGALLGLAADYFMENKFDDAWSTNQLALNESPENPKAHLDGDRNSCESPFFQSGRSLLTA